MKEAIDFAIIDRTMKAACSDFEGKSMSSQDALYALLAASKWLAAGMKIAPEEFDSVLLSVGQDYQELYKHAHGD